MADWDAAIDAWNDLLHSYETEEGAIYLSSFLTDYATKRPGETMWQNAEQLAGLGRGIIGSLNVATPMWVSSEIVDLVEHAAKSFEPEPIMAEDLINPYGFIYLEKPIVTIDRKGKTVSWRGLQGGEFTVEEEKTHKSRKMILVVFYAQWGDPNDYEAEYSNSMRPIIVGGSKLSLLHFATIFSGIQPNIESDNEIERQASIHQLATVQTLWRMAQQEIATPHPERPSRSARKRIERAGREPKEITVLRLRRIYRSTSEEGATDINWTQRWLVRGHWRRQWYPSLETHRQRWIAPYIKGPEDKPLVLKKSVIDFSR